MRINGFEIFNMIVTNEIILTKSYWDIWQFFTFLCKIVGMHLKDVNTLYSCNLIQVEGWLPSTWMTLHGGNVFTFLNVSTPAE